MRGLKLVSICLIGFVFIFAIVQFFLILRHKSPYTSDTYFYKHLAYQLDGKSYQSSKKLILKEASGLAHDKISRNIFENEKLYDSVYVYFIKRPVYPVLIYLFHKITGNYFQALLIPVFIGYLGTIFAAYYLLIKRFETFFATIGICLFISFYPYLDLSTYFLTDSINSFFWLIFLILIYKYCTTKRKIFLRGYVLLLTISIFTREQSLLFPLVVLLVLLLNRLYHSAQVPLKIFTLSVFVSVLYFIFSFVTHQRTLVDALFYTEASYGFREINRNYTSLLAYMQRAIIASHVALFRDLASHHWWSAFSVMGVLGAGYQFLIFKKPNLLDLLVLCSGIVSYLAIFLYPVLSYRYFYPSVFCVIYFAILLLKKINANLIQNNL
jgi:hypothetical protein